MSSPDSSDTAFAARVARVVACVRCPELRAYCARVALEKKRAHRDDAYWGRPVPAFGDPRARVLLVGLAPGAHGSNRTGRMFTGDASGVWLFRALFRAGFANTALQRDRNDGLVLHDALITAALHCAPPLNKPTPAELKRCFSYLVEDIASLPDLRVVVGLGAIGTRAAVAALRAAGYTFDARPAFGHGSETVARRPTLASVTLLCSYHPSRQNTNTGVLTEPMLDAIFVRARTLLDATVRVVPGEDGATHELMGMKLSARNQLRGRVTAVRTGEIMAEVEIAIEAAEMTAVTTRGSVTSLGLATGDEVTVIVKSTEVMVAKE